MKGAPGAAMGLEAGAVLAGAALVGAALDPPSVCRVLGARSHSCRGRS